MKLKIKEGTTSKLVKVFIQDTSSPTGSGLTGLVYNSSGLDAYYIAEGDASPTAITLATATVGTYTSGGFKEVHATQMPGVYELGLPDAVIDNTSEGSTLVMMKGATNMLPVLLEIELDKVGYRDTNNQVTSNITQIGGSGITDTIRDSVVDDATRIDASALNQASTAIGTNGAGLTEAGGTGDHLTQVVPSGLAIVSGVVSSNITLIEGLDPTNQIRDAVVDDATRIDASALNQASTTIGTDGAGLTEAGGTGDHLTQVAPSGTVTANMAQLAGSTNAANKLKASAEGIISGLAQSGTLTTTSMTTDLTGYLSNELIGRRVVWTSGDAAGQSSIVTAYAATNGQVTYNLITTAPVNNDPFVIV